jgi:hypothetical protein
MNDVPRICSEAATWSPISLFSIMLDNASVPSLITIVDVDIDGMVIGRLSILSYIEEY